MAAKHFNELALKSKLKRIDFQMICVLGMLTVGLLFYLGYANWLLHDPVESRSMDFMCYYSVAQITRQQGIAQIYKIDLQNQAYQNVLGYYRGKNQNPLFLHPPYLVPILASFTSNHYEVTYLIWMLCLLFIILTYLWLLTSLLPELPKPWPWLLAGSLFFRPVFISILQGQDSAFLLLGLSVFLWGMLNERESMAGLGLSLLTLRPQMALFFILPMFFWSRRAFWAYLSGCLFLVMVSIFMLGSQGTLDYIQILKISSGGEWFGMSETHMVNLLGLALRSFPTLDAKLVRTAAWWFFGLSMLGTGLFFALSKMSFGKKFGLGILIFVLASPHLHYHDLSLLVIPTTIWLRELGRERPESLKTASLVMVSINMLMLFTFMLFSIYIIPYFLVCLLTYALLRQPNFSIITQKQAFS
ncbi:MAG TPA: glycosyltransferase family 87 protein [Anaerolineales bacterium]|jgi:hypothetical protein